jgi:succinate-semialdehyde dehydrogenase / glutarate-semialdehyde dehydrogenase
MTVEDQARMYIDGMWAESSDGGCIDVTNPATERVIARVPKATMSDVDRALEAAEKGWLTWRATDPWTRSECLRAAAAVLRDRREELASVLTQQQGKPLAESRSEIRGAWEQFEWFADEARRISGDVLDARPEHYALVVREPIGPVAAFTPWNFPALLPARKIAPALAAGCSMILKPADEAPGVAFALAQACELAGLPPGVLNVITGDAAQISARLLGSRIIRKLTLTGSVPVGRVLLRAAAENIVDTTMELGGHAPTIVMRDSSPRDAARRCVAAKYRNAGQVCISPTRFYVHREIYREYCEAFVAEVGQLRVGNGSDPETNVGPLNNSRRLDAIAGLVDDALAAGARLAIGGRRPADQPVGHYFQPTVLIDVPESARIMQEEPFGPVAPISVYDDIEEALNRANGTPYGLAGYVLTDDMSAGLKAAARLDVGMVGVNDFALSYAGVPFGGRKLSGIGTESGSSAMDSYLARKSIHLGSAQRTASASARTRGTASQEPGQ